jgi:hypothetical protein
MDYGRRNVVKRQAITFAAVLFLTLELSINVLAQVNATVGGTVSDTSGALIPGVEVTAKNVNTGITDMRITNETGSYDFASLQPGQYSVSAMLSGFQTAIYNNVQLSQGQQVRLNFALQVGTVAQAVQVVAEANTLLATTSASVGAVVPEAEVRTLPLASRNVLDLSHTTAGAVGDNFDGARTTQLNTTRDGLPTMDGRYNSSNGVYSAIFTSPDLVEEVQVITNNVDPALGRGAIQVRMQTRSGTNEFHGAVFYSNNNSALNAQPWFNNLVGAARNYTNRNQFGARLGGPIIKNKAFFFVLTDDQRYLEKVYDDAVVLTGPARQGIFRYLTQNATGTNGGLTRRNGNAFATIPSVSLAGQTLTADPTTGAPLFLNSFNLFSDVKDPNRTQIDPVWFGPQYLTRMPLPNNWTVGDGLNTAGFQWLQPHNGLDSATGKSPSSNRNHLTTRFDYQITAKEKLNFVMSVEDDWGVTGQTGLADFPKGYNGTVERIPYFYTLGLTSTLSPLILSEFRVGLKMDNWYGTSPFHNGCCRDGAGEDDISASSKEALASYPQIPGISRLFYTQPGLGLGSYAPFSSVAAAPRFNTSPLGQLAENVSWIKGTHSFQAGFEFTRSGSSQRTTGGIGTSFPYATLGIGNIPIPNIDSAHFAALNSNDISTAQNVVANLSGTIANIAEKFVTNSPKDTSYIDFTKTAFVDRVYRQNDWAAFFRDTWKVTKNLTLNLGLRYDKYGIPYDITGMGQRPLGGQAALFGCSGTSFSVMWNPNVGCNLANLTQVEFAGKGYKALPYNDDWKDFGPAVGFSWSLPWFKQSTVLRGGYGIAYGGGLPEYQNYGRQIGAQPGSQIVVTYTPATYLDINHIATANIIPLPLNGVLPSTPTPLTNRTTQMTAYADNRRTQYTQSFNLSLQRQLSRDTTLEVSYIGSKGTRLWGQVELNEDNIFENGILDAFNVTRAGGNAPLFDQILKGLNVTGVGVVNGTTLTGSQALRKFSTTNQWLANGSVAALANWFNTTSALTGQNGGLLRNGKLPENFIVVNPQFGSDQLFGNNDNSIYHSLQMQVTKRLSRGVTGQFAYTWSKNLGNSANNPSTRDPRNWHLQRGLLNIDHTNNFQAHGTYELPFGPDRKFLSKAPSWAQRIVEGWDVSGIMSHVSGDPLSFTSTLNTIAFASSVNTADLVGSIPKGIGGVRKESGFVDYFHNSLSTSAAPMPNFGGDTSLPGRFSNQVVSDRAGNIVLQNPMPGKTGNTAVGFPSLRGPGMLNLDMALSKRIRIGENNRMFTMRLDAVGFLNRPIWADPTTDINSTAFGRITTASGSRVVTLNARVDF